MFLFSNGSRIDTCFLFAYFDLSGRHVGGKHDGGDANANVPSATMEEDDMEGPWGPEEGGKEAGPHTLSAVD